LREGRFEAGGFGYGLERLDDGWWRFHNSEFGGAPNFDFTEAPVAPALLEEKCRWLQTWPDSPFVTTATAQRHRPGEILVLRGRVLRRVRPHGTEDILIGDAKAYVDLLARDFDLHVPQAAELWPRILARHTQLFGESTA
jgi:arylamine N-acetyltransferase